jgi:hypothetical protein
MAAGVEPRNEMCFLGLEPGVGDSDFPEAQLEAPAADVACKPDEVRLSFAVSSDGQDESVFCRGPRLCCADITST